MKPGFTSRQAVIAALTANAIRPIPGFRTGIAAFFNGWLADELAPHLLAVTATDAATHLGGRRRNVPGLLLASASAAGLGYLILRGRRSEQQATDALLEGLGEALPPAVRERLPVGSLANPFAYGRTRRKLGVQVIRNIAYGDHPKRNLLDIHTSEATPPSGAPVLLEVHGGGWTIGSKEQQALPLLTRMASKGWVGVTINYRLAPKHPWPAQIVDVKRAIAWVKENIADYGGDPSYIVITGGSAGGHLSALAALTPGDKRWQPGFEDADTSVRAAVPHYGVYDLSGTTGLKSVLQLRDKFLKGWVIKADPRTEIEVYEDASPILRITEDAPDFFVLHGDQDTLVRVGQARAFVERLREVSPRTVSYAEFRGAQHAFDLFPSIRSVHALRAVDRFLTWHHEAWRSEGRLEAAR